MFSSMFCFRPGRVKLLEPTSACDPDDVELAVRGVRLGMELVAVVDPCFDLAEHLNPDISIRGMLHKPLPPGDYSFTGFPHLWKKRVRSLRLKVVLL